MSDPRINRRELAALGAALVASPWPVLAQRRGWRLGCQSYSFRKFDLAGAIRNVRALGLNALELYSAHLSVDSSRSERKATLRQLDDAGVDAVCFGVVGFDGSEQDRKVFEFAQSVGLTVLSANPKPESLDGLERLTEEFGIDIAIHNHGKGFLYKGVDDVEAAVRGRSKRIGACVDTGHALRYGDRPDEFVRRLGDRVHGLHLKDWVYGGHEQVVGEGDLNLRTLVAALEDVDFSGPVMLEYEEHPDAPVEPMRRGVNNWRAAAT